jgi:hypothetical protein
VNTTANVWANTTTLTFRANVFEILTYGLTRTNRFSNNDPTKRATCFLLTQSMFTDLGSQIEGKQTYFITKKVGSNEDQGLGSNVDQLWHGGIPVYWDENLPANTGYCTNLNQMGLKIQPLVEWGDSKGEGLAQDGDDNEWFELDLDFNSSRRSMLVAATLPGQFWFNPRFLTQFYAGA